MKRFFLMSVMTAAAVAASASTPKTNVDSPASPVTFRGEPEPGDTRGGGRGKDDKKPHALLQDSTFRGEPEPGDTRGRGRGKDDKKPHA